MTAAATAAHASIDGASARGFSHIHRNKPNQDARGGWSCGDWRVIAVSDGHGGDAYFRSDRGSRFAVEAVRQAFSAFSDNGSATAADLDRLHAGFVDLPARIVAAWHQAVLADIAADPDPQLPPHDPQVAYGATCIAAAFGPGVSVFLQIGDGDLLAAPAGGDLSKPLPDDEGLEGEQTYSLCNANAVAHFRSKLFGAPHPLSAPRFAMASSDGLAKSFARDAQFLDVARHWRALVEQNGLPAACADLAGWLAKCSELGSGDDITMMMYYDPGAEAPVASATAPQGGATHPRARAPLAIAAPTAAADAAAARNGDAAAAWLPHASAAKSFGVGTLAAAAALGAAIGVGATYYAMHSPPAAAPLAPAPVTSPLQPDAPAPHGQKPRQAEPEQPASPKQLGVPARPGTPRRSKEIPVTGAPPLPLAPQQPAEPAPPPEPVK